MELSKIDRLLDELTTMEKRTIEVRRQLADALIVTVPLTRLATFVKSLAPRSVKKNPPRRPAATEHKAPN